MIPFPLTPFPRSLAPVGPFVCSGKTIVRTWRTGGSVVTKGTERENEEEGRAHNRRETEPPSCTTFPLHLRSHEKRTEEGRPTLSPLGHFPPSQTNAKDWRASDEGVAKEGPEGAYRSYLCVPLPLGVTERRPLVSSFLCTQSRVVPFSHTRMG